MAKKSIFKEGVKAGGSFTGGFLAMFRSMKTVSENRGLMRYFIIPFLLNIVILTGVVFISYTFLYSWISGFMTGDSFFIRALGFMVRLVLILGLVLLTTIIYSTVGSVVIAPFNDVISLRVEEKITGADFREDFSLPAFLADMGRILSNIVKLLVLVIIVNILISFINLVPLVGTVIFSILSFLITAFFAGFNFFDFPLDRRKLSFGEKLKVLWRFKFPVMGLGTGFFLFSFIPVINFLGLNLGAVGATLIFIEDIRPVLADGSGSGK